MEEIERSYRFNIGNFACTVVRDTISPMELEFLFSSTPMEKLSQLLNRYHIPPGEVMDVMCLYMKTPDHNILIDTGWGIGQKANEGKLIENLQNLGIRCEDIDTVILSHGHPDHIGGLIDDNGRLYFPEAYYHIYYKGWEYWNSRPDLTQYSEMIQGMMLAAVQKNLVPIKDRLNLIDSGGEILPGIECISAPGHSPDHSVLMISSGTERLLYSADLFQHPVQLAHPDLCTGFDLVPEQAVASRTQMINRAVEANLPVFACHFPFPGLGYIVSGKEYFSWKLVKEQA